MQLITTLATLPPLLLAANALMFEPPSVKRHAPVRELSKRVPQVQTTWVKLGCYVDTVNPRALKGATTVSEHQMSNAYCQSYCAGLGYSFAGTEWGQECFCDNAIDASLAAPNGDCNMKCSSSPGNTEICGGSARMTVYQRTGGSTDDPSLGTYGQWKGQGCYGDSTANRAIATRMPLTASTIEKCTAACKQGNYKYAGLEFGDECYCSNTIYTSGEIGAPAASGCTMPCAGNPDQRCGGPNRINIFTYTGPTTGPGNNAVQIQSTGDWNLKGCYTDNVSNRAIALRTSVDGKMTVEKCTAKCLTLGYTLSGVEYATECYCSNEIATGANSGAVAQDGCNMPCEGASNQEICGGAGRITVYEYHGNAVIPAPTVLASYNGWNSIGCYVDSVSARVLTAAQNVVKPMTVGHCVDACAAAGFVIAGVEFGSECYCGNAIPPVSATDNCIMKCEGDNYLCGGPNRLNVYQQSPPAATP